MNTLEELERRVAALEERVQDRDKIIASLYLRFLPHPYSLRVAENDRSALEELIKSLRQVLSGEKRVRSWNVEHRLPELEE
jgi:hypothetical protein